MAAFRQNFQRVRYQLFILWVGERHYKVLCQRSQRAWKKKKKKGGDGGGKRKEREMLCLAMLAWIPSFTCQKNFLNIPLLLSCNTSNDDTFPAGVYRNTSRLRNFLFSSRRKKMYVMKINPYNCGDKMVNFPWEFSNWKENRLTPD